MTFQRRKAGDPTIIGVQIYDIDTQQLIGVPQLASRHPEGGWMVIVRLPGDNPDDLAHLHLDEVLINVDSPEGTDEEATVELPVVHTDPQGLDQRAHTGIPVSSSPEREKKLGLAAGEHREPGVAEDEAALPRLSDPDPDPHDRPAGPYVDPRTKQEEATLYPGGKPLGRKKEDGPENAAHSGGIPKMIGGTTMASVGEVKAALDAALAKADEAAGAVRAGIEILAEAQQMVAVVLESSTDDGVATANAQLGHANQQFEDGIQAIQAAREAYEQYGAGL